MVPSSTHATFNCETNIFGLRYFIVSLNKKESNLYLVGTQDYLIFGTIFTVALNEQTYLFGDVLL